MFYIYKGINIAILAIHPTSDNIVAKQVITERKIYSFILSYGKWNSFGWLLIPQVIIQRKVDSFWLLVSSGLHLTSTTIKYGHQWLTNVTGIRWVIPAHRNRCGRQIRHDKFASWLWHYVHTHHLSNEAQCGGFPTWWCTNACWNWAWF